MTGAKAFVAEERGGILIEAALSIPLGVLFFTAAAEFILACVTFAMVEWSASYATERYLDGAEPVIIAEEVGARIARVLPTRRPQVYVEDGQIVVPHRLGLLPSGPRIISFSARYIP